MDTTYKLYITDVDSELYDIQKSTKKDNIPFHKVRVRTDKWKKRLNNHFKSLNK